jgi:hypothetical protein
MRARRKNKIPSLGTRVFPVDVVASNGHPSALNESHFKFVWRQGQSRFLFLSLITVIRIIVMIVIVILVTLIVVIIIRRPMI